MPELVDTSILIRQLRGDTRASELLSYLYQHGRPLISPITVTELFVGCQNERHLRGVRSIMRRFKTVPITATIAQKTAYLIQKYPQFFGHGVQRGIADALILACAWERNATLYTINTRHFAAARISEVRIHAIDPTTEVWR